MKTWLSGMSPAAAEFASAFSAPGGAAAAGPVVVLHVVGVRVDPGRLAGRRLAACVRVGLGGGLALGARVLRLGPGNLAGPGRLLLCLMDRCVLPGSGMVLSGRGEGRAADD